jgi:hypothetical protein
MKRPWLLGISFVLSAALAVACVSSGDTGAATPSLADASDAGTVLPSGHLGGEAGPPGDGAAPPPQTNIRIALLSPDLPAVDVCLAPHGTASYQGPLVAELGGGEAGGPGLAYAQVSAYVAVSPDRYDLHFVAAGSTSCAPSSPLDGGADGGAFPTALDVANLPELRANAFATLIIAGELSPVGTDRGLTISIVTDDAQLAGGAASLRAINALSSGAALDLGFGSFASKWTAVLTDVAFASASARADGMSGVVDANGYVSIPSLSGATVSVRATSGATGDIAIAKGVDLPFGSIGTLVAIGRANDAAHPPALLLCVDNQPSGGRLSDCSPAE